MTFDQSYSSHDFEQPIYQNIAWEHFFPFPSSPPSLSFPPSSFPSSSLFSSLSSSLSPSVDYQKSYLRATDNHCVSNSSNKPIHMYPQLPEREIQSLRLCSHERGTDRQKDRQTVRQTDRWTTYTFTRSPFFKATAASDLSGEKWQTQLLRDIHVGNAIPANTGSSNHTGGIN